MLQSAHLPNLKSLSQPTTQIWQAIQNVKNGVVWDFGVVRVTGNSAIRQSSYELLLAFHSNYVPILHRFWDISRYSSKPPIWTYPTCLVPQLGVTTLEFRRHLWHQKSRIADVVCVIPGLAVLVQYWRVTDGRTDGQTDTRRQHIPC